MPVEMSDLRKVEYPCRSEESRGNSQFCYTFHSFILHFLLHSLLLRVKGDTHYVLYELSVV